MTVALAAPRSLPNGKPISALGFGCASMWAKPAFDASLANAILERAADDGLNHFDTSPSYGNGVGEERLAAFLSGRATDRFVLSTKVGTNLVDGKIVRGFDIALIEHSFDASMRRLKLHHVDILYLHGPTIADLDEPIFAFFARLKSSGRISYSGVNSFDAPVLDRCVASPIDAVMLQYNIGDMSLASQMKALHAAGKIVLSGTALARSVFDLKTFIPRDAASLWYLLRALKDGPGPVLAGQRLARRLALVEGSPHATAVRFVTGQEEITSNLFGTTKLEHVTANVAASRRPLSSAECAMLSIGAHSTRTH